MAAKRYVTAEGYPERLQLIRIREDWVFRLAVCRSGYAELEIPVYRTDLATPEDLKHHPDNW